MQSHILKYLIKTITFMLVCISSSVWSALILNVDPNSEELYFTGSDSGTKSQNSERVFWKQNGWLPYNNQGIGFDVSGVTLNLNVSTSSNAIAVLSSELDSFVDLVAVGQRIDYSWMMPEVKTILNNSHGVMLGNNDGSSFDPIWISNVNEEDVLTEEQFYLELQSQVLSFRNTNPASDLNTVMTKIELANGETPSAWQTFRALDNLWDYMGIALCTNPVSCALSVGSHFAVDMTLDSIEQAIEDFNEGLPLMLNIVDQLIEHFKYSGNFEDFFEQTLKGWIGLGSPADIQITLKDGTVITKSDGFKNGYQYIEWTDFFGDIHDMVVFTDEDLLGLMEISVIGDETAGQGETFSLFKGGPLGVKTLAISEPIYVGEKKLYTTVIGVPEPSTLAIFALGMIGLASRRFKK